jgi:hypothetical protein
MLAPVTAATPAHADSLSDEAYFVGSINALRASHGLASLTVDVRLTSVASAWSNQMAATNQLAQNPNIATLFPPGWTAIGENVGYGPSLAAVESAFENSPDHLANMLKPDYSAIGVGVVWAGATAWVTEDFMAGVAPVPPAASQVVGMAAMRGARRSPGYWVATSNGAVHSFGAAPYYGSMAGHSLSAPIIAMSATSDSGGYWLLGADGGIFNFGDAGFYGSTGGMHLNAPAVAMSGTPSGHGYWIVAADGGIFSFGDARFYGSTGAMRLNAPVVGISASTTGGGYRLVATDGGIFDFGSAPFYGSMGRVRLNRPVIGMSTDPATGGYRMVASDGGVFDFNAAYYGSLAGASLPAPITSMAATVSGNGYYLIGGAGNIYCFGDAVFLGNGKTA